MSGKIDTQSTAELIESLDTWLASGAEIELEEPDDHFGLCPICYQAPIFYHVGRKLYGACETHRVYWYIGDNILSIWRELSEDDYKAAARELATMRKVGAGYSIDKILYRE